MPKFKAEKSLKQRLVFSEKNGLQLWSDFLQIQVKKSLKQRWDFSDKKGLHPWSDLLKLKVEISLKQRLHFSYTNTLNYYGQIPLNSSPKIIKRWLDFTDKKGLQLSLDFLQI